MFGSHVWLVRVDRREGLKTALVRFIERNAAAFFFAGLFSERWDGLVSYTILTRDADPTIAHLHNRMPIV